MVDQSDIELVEDTGDAFRFQFRGREAFDELVNAPEWAEEAVETISEGASVQLGRLPDSEMLRVESVRVPKTRALGREEAKNAAEEIVEELHSR